VNVQSDHIVEVIYSFMSAANHKNGASLARQGPDAGCSAGSQCPMVATPFKGPQPIQMHLFFSPF
jgi:hypothetical protein